MPGSLGEYRAKRNFGTTAEPEGGEVTAEESLRFVIQEHDATRLHWDLRLEHGGVLVSWAVPKGLPEAPNENHFAAATEDHPLEYLDFDGEIPKGEYGAGTMKIWDRGTYERLKWEPRKVEVALHGERLDARYALFAIADGEKPKTPPKPMAENTTAALVTFAEIIGLPLQLFEGRRAAGIDRREAIAGPPERQFCHRLAPRRSAGCDGHHKNVECFPLLSRRHGDGRDASFFLSILNS